jgi:Xaa-Pro dipeptidase
MDIAKIQDYLAEHKLDGWLMADFHARNSVAVQMLKLSGMVTRRSFYFIPAMGEPVGLVHAVEKSRFDDLPGKIIAYSGYRELEQELKSVLRGCGRIAMEYSSMGRLPYIGLVDYGTIELIKSFDVEVVSSADLVAHFQARLSPEQMAAHRIAANNVIEIKDGAFEFIKERLTAGQTISEYDLARFVLDQFDKYDMETHDSPICGVNGNAGNPHYEPTAERSAKINKGDLILLDLWGRIKHPEGVYADITWMAYAGTANEIPAQYRSLFGIVTEARDTAVAYLREHIGNRPVYGAEVDDACRKVIVDAGYGDYFTHRTGHSITGEGHGPGPNIDNLETEDTRKLQKGHLFSLEPGIYMDEVGFRSEINVLIGHDGVEITTLPMQTEIVAVF